MGRMLLLGGILVAAPAFAQQEPPSVEGQIDPTRFDDGNRSIVVRVLHLPEISDPTSIQLVKSRAYVRRGDVGPILVEVLNRDGAIEDSWRAPRPGRLTGEEVGDEEARYAIPYSKALAGITISDTELGTSTSFRFDEVIEAFCLAQPNDVACDRVDLSTDISPETNAPQTVAVGESITIAVNATFRNAQGETSGASINIAPFFVSPNLRVETQDETSATESRIDGAFEKTMRVNYEIGCEAAGAGRIFPEAVIFASGGPSVVDIDLDNNRWNTILDVLCVP